MTEEQWSRAGWRNAEKHIDQLEAEIAMLRSQLRAADDMRGFAEEERNKLAAELRKHIAKVKLEES